MDKRGVSWVLTVVIVFMVLIIGAFVILVGFRGNITDMFDWVGTQVKGFEGVSLFDKAEFKEDLTKGEITELKKTPKEYMAWLYDRGRVAFGVGDYPDALTNFQAYVDNCEDPKLKEGCIENDLKKIKKNIESIGIITSAIKDFADIKNLPEGSQRQAYETFIDEYEDKGVGLTKVRELVNKAKETIDEVYIDTIEGKNKEELITILKTADRLRIGIGNSEKIKEKLRFIRESDKADDQIRAEARFMLLVIKADDKDCSDGENIVRMILTEHGGLDFEYIKYSYPRSDYDNEPYSIADWKSNEIVNEANLVWGWCNLETRNFVEAYNIAKLLEKNIHRDALYKEVVLNLADPIKCGERGSLSSCHSFPKSVFISSFGIEVINVQIMIDEIVSYPKLGCWWSYDGLAGCESCLDVGFCGDYKTGWGKTRWAEFRGYDTWEEVCEENPCETNYSPDERKVLGCEVFGDECRAIVG